VKVHTATLSCGTVLSYEARSFLPTTSEWVPCRNHGYCAVINCSRAQAPRTRSREVIRARPRTQPELVDWLERCPVTTLAALRRHRFTLRLITRAQRDGLVAVDEGTGAVALAGH
jgi:hypothetical protein